MKRASRPLCVAVLTIVLAWAGTIAAATPARKPAVLFLSLPMQAHYGGAYLRRNMARLDGLGYRVAYYAYRDFYRKKPSRIQDFDVVVLLDQPGIDYKGTGKLRPATTAMYAEIRKLLRAGGGLMLFTPAHEFYIRSFWALSKPYGLRPLVGCLMDDSPVLATYGYLSYAYTTQIKPGALTQGVRGIWYPVGGTTGRRTHYDTLRNANTVPFDVDASWTVLASPRASTSFVGFGPKEGADSAWLQQPQFKKLTPKAAPLVAVRDGAEGKGRIGVCGISRALTDFVAGNTVYDGVCTGKGLEGQPSDLDKLLMNVLDWLGEGSVTAGRKTIPASVKASFALPPFKFPAPKKVGPTRPLRELPDQFQGVVGVRSTYSGGKSTVAEYAKAARELGIDYLAFLEDFSKLESAKFEAFQKECEAASDEKLLLIPGIRVQNELGIHFFGFRIGLKLPQPSHLKPGTRRLTQAAGGQYLWATLNGHRYGMACGNFRLEEKEPAGVPPSDYNVHNPFVSIYTYRDGKQVDTMFDTYLKCAARTEWVSPIVVNLIDSAEALRREWASRHFRTVWLRNPGQGLAGFKKSIGDRFAVAPVTYITNGPRIDEWRSTGHDGAGGWWDWTRYRCFARMVISSDVGLKEIRVLNGRKLYRRFLPRAADGTPAKRFEHTLVLTYSNMHNLILDVTDVTGGRALSDEEWGKNQLLQLTWCGDRINMLGYAGLPAPKAASGSTAGNYPVPCTMEKGGFRETLSVHVNQDRSRLPHFDGQPMHMARVSPAPTVILKDRSEGSGWIARDIGRDLSSPDAAIQTASCRLVYDNSVVKKPHPGVRGPLVPMKLFHADMRYTTFSHAGHQPAPVILDGKITILKDLTFPRNRHIGIRPLSMTAWRRWSGYDTFAIQHSKTANLVGRISYVGEPTVSSYGAFNHGAYAYFYPSMFGSVGVVSLTDDLVYQYRNKCLHVGFDTLGKTVKAGTEFTYRLIVLTSGFDEFASTRLPEMFRRQLGIAEKGKTSYTVRAEHGTVKSTEYVLTIDGKGLGFAGEIVLPRGFPVSLPIIVQGLNGRWTSVLYDRQARRMRPLGMAGDAAYCHRALAEPRGRIFIGHPFTLDKADLCLSVVQTGTRELTVQIHNPTDHPLSSVVRRSRFFDMVSCHDLKITVPAGQTMEYVLTGKRAKRVP